MLEALPSRRHEVASFRYFDFRQKESDTPIIYATQDDSHQQGPATHDASTGFKVGVSGRPEPTLYSATAVPKTQYAIVTPHVQPKLNLQLHEIPVDNPQPGEVTVKVEWSGLCASDIYFSTGRDPVACSRNHIAGHEGIGHIVLSHDPSLVGRAVGMRFLAHSCGTCCYCLRGVPENCPEQLCFPTDVNGTYRQFLNVPYKMLTWLPDWVFAHPTPAIFTAALCSGSAALKALKKAALRPGDVVVILGIGGQIGYLAGLMAKKVFRARVIGVDLAMKGDFPSVAEASDRFIPLDGDDCLAGQPDLTSPIVSACTELRGDGLYPRKANAVIAASNTIASFQNLPSFVCDGGSIILIGAPSGSIKFDVAEIVVRQLSIQGSLMGNESESYEVMEFIQSGVITPTITEIDLKDIPKYMSNFVACQNEGKVVARVNDPSVESWKVENTSEMN
ncbi:hypothetical protein CEP51_013897 [Fusarium floridanum]|uniref:alcohol dehydrogenase n=1 Tax=Fusarium floridanum TaxID=1325733 RepID=A0A428Q2V2_9HYPO|nr:hypothetical protein CEP51_013897 [Fusarium floridanum]